jgi:nucleotide-binding universal stress UspA family protein
MYQHILVAIDDNETSRLALDEAFALAKLHNAPLDIVHAVDKSLVQAFSTRGTTPQNVRQLEQTLLDKGQTILAEATALAEAAGVAATPRLLASHDCDCVEQVCQAIEETGADLLVVGSHGRRGLRRLLLGSVAEDLLRKVSISILIVRRHGGAGS